MMFNIPPNIIMGSNSLINPSNTRISIGEGIAHGIIANISGQFRMIIYKYGMKSTNMLTKWGCTWDILGT